MVPHIFAENDHDLYSAQGFLPPATAFANGYTTRSAAGRLSEIVGPRHWKLTVTIARMAWFYAAGK